MGDDHKQLNSLVETLKLKDLGSNMDISSRWTRIDKKSSKKSRLDYIFASEKLVCDMKDTKLIMPVKSDHKAVMTVLTLNQLKRGPGYFKLNAEILKDDNTKHIIINMINNLKLNYADKNPCLLWEMIKIESREILMTISKERAKNRKRLRLELETKLEEIDRETNTNIEHREQIQLELDKYYESEARGVQIRARAQWLEQGERNTKYFANIEKHQQQANCIKMLSDKDNNLITDNNGILKECTNFYRELYTSSKPSQDDINNYLSTLDLNVVNEQDKIICEKEINDSECWEAILKIKENKAPGQDGLTIEFYKTFWNVLKDIYIKTINESLLKGELPRSMRQSVISLIYKKGDKDKLKNLFIYLFSDLCTTLYCSYSHVLPYSPKIIKKLLKYNRVQ